MEGDPGVQNERTALSWQRTALSLLAAAAAVSRLTLHRLGPAALLCVLTTLPLSMWVFREARERYRQDLHIATSPHSRGGGAPICVALATAVIAATELAALMSAALEN